MTPVDLPPDGLVPGEVRLVPVGQAPSTARLVLERHGGVTLGWLDHRGAPLAARGGAFLPLSLPGFERGMGLQPIGAGELGPGFASDARLLGDDNRLLVWRRGVHDGQRFHVLVPLAAPAGRARLGKHDGRFGLGWEGERPVAAGRVPLFAHHASPDPYRAVREAIAAAVARFGEAAVARPALAEPGAAAEPPGEHAPAAARLFRRAYANVWLSAFGRPDWGPFRIDEAGTPTIALEAIARAVSGGQIRPLGMPHPNAADVLAALRLADGRMLRPDGPGVPSPGSLLEDASLTADALELTAGIYRPGYQAGVVACLDVRNGPEGASAMVDYTDARLPLGSIAVWQPTRRKAMRLAPGACLGQQLPAGGATLAVLVPFRDGAAIFGRTDKYLGPAAVSRVDRRQGRLGVSLLEGGEFGAWLDAAPRRVTIDGRTAPPGSWRFEPAREQPNAPCGSTDEATEGGLFMLQAAAFPGPPRPSRVELELATATGQPRR